MLELEKLINDTFGVSAKFKREKGKNGKKYIEVVDGYLEIGKTTKDIYEKIEKVSKFFSKSYSTQVTKQAQENFINDVLNFRFANIDLMLNRSEILGFDFYIKRQAILIEIENIYIILKEKKELILQQFKDEFYEIVLKVLDNPKDIVSYVGDNKFVICKSEDEKLYEKLDTLLEKLKEKWDLSYKISIGDKYDMPGIESVVYSYRDSLQYLKMGKKFLNKDKIYDFQKVGMYLLFSGLQPFQKSKILNYIKNLTHYEEKNKIKIRHAIETLVSNNFNMTNTSKKLKMPRNKLKNLVDITYEVTGLNPLEFDDAIKLYISLKLWEA